MFIMKTTEEVITSLPAVVLLTFAFVSCTLPSVESTPFKTDSKTDEITHLLTELRNALDSDPKSDLVRTNDSPLSDISLSEFLNTKIPLRLLNSEPIVQELRGHPLLSALLSSKGDNSKDIGINKRQGGWDYDYGLGGGRFGKRGRAADYSLGGGRFGRDVDHVMGQMSDMEGGEADYDGEMVD